MPDIFTDWVDRLVQATPGAVRAINEITAAAKTATVETEKLHSEINATVKDAENLEGSKSLEAPGTPKGGSVKGALEAVTADLNRRTGR